VFREGSFYEKWGRAVAVKFRFILHRIAGSPPVAFTIAAAAGSIEKLDDVDPLIVATRQDTLSL
jgi:hypothetical protein